MNSPLPPVALDPLQAPSSANGWHRAHALLLAASYRRWTGRPLIEPDDDPDLGRRLDEAPFVLLSHGLGADPLFTYGNRTALALFAVDWAGLLRTPSRLSAEPIAQPDRARLLARVASSGFIDDYAGIRIARSGRRFRIDGATVWTLVGFDGAPCGQAARFAEWTWL